MLPFQILGVGLDADDAAVAEAYRRMILKFPPETHPDEFKRIRNAYEAIDSEEKRLHRSMGFDLSLANQHSSTPLEAALAFLRDAPEPPPPSQSRFYEFLDA